jgi:hypothetical protein
MNKRDFKRFSVIFYKILLTVLLAAGSAFSQRSKIIGTVKDANSGEPLFGANVVVLNTTPGGATEFYIINVPAFY